MKNRYKSWQITVPYTFPYKKQFKWLERFQRECGSLNTTVIVKEKMNFDEINKRDSNKHCMKKLWIYHRQEGELLDEILECQPLHDEFRCYTIHQLGNWTMVLASFCVRVLCCDVVAAVLRILLLRILFFILPLFLQPHYRISRFSQSALSLLMSLSLTSHSFNHSSI